MAFINLTSIYGQTTSPVQPTLSVGGKLETVFDRFGKKYRLSEILRSRVNITPTPAPSATSVATTTNLISCSSTSIFNLYFEPGCGMESATDPTHIARRSVVCKVFEDISNFINTPLSTNGNKVNIWVRDINQVVSTPSAVLGIGSSFYNAPYSTITGGIEDSEIWKTITLGADSYTNVSSPLGTGISITSMFYHGMVAFNFNTTGSVSWHTNLATLPATGTYDLYSVALKEVTHALGFASLIDQNGDSVFGAGYKYYSRYDRFLKNNANNRFLITNTGACNTMYNYNFNPLLSTSSLRPGCILPNNLFNGNSDNTNCTYALKYAGNTNTVPVYTPTCFEKGISFSHFEDQCVAPNVNNAYYTMSNANLATTIKRYLKPQERNTLCDIGYSVKTTYGTSSTLNGFFSYGGTTCAGITVAGMNDGLNPGNTYTYIGNQGTNIPIPGNAILNNDRSGNGNPTAFICLEDITNTPIPLLASGNNTTIYNFNSSIPGLHILRYVPINGTVRGNITYIYVFVIETTSCAIPSSCNIVVNGDFEQYSSTLNPGGTGGIRLNACGWFDVSGSYDYTLTGGPEIGNPCGNVGYEPCNNSSGFGYIQSGSIQNATNNDKFFETVVTKLKTPLAPNTTYQLSFEVSLAEGESRFARKMQAYFSDSLSPMPSSSTINITNPSMLFVNPTVSIINNGWEIITFNFTTTTGGEQYLYLGPSVSNLDVAPNTQAPIYTGCSYGNNLTWVNLQPSMYYFDNVKLISITGTAFNLPNTTNCQSLIISNLTTLLSGLPINGVFSGPGVSLSSGVYSFNTSLSGDGIKTIGYTYTNTAGCLVTLYKKIDVSVQNMIANNDSFSFYQSAGSQTSNSFFTNDTYNGVLLTAGATNVTAGQVGIPPTFVTGGITINPNGTLAILANTTSGAYTLQYQLYGVCGSSNMATITVDITDPIVLITPKIPSFDFCYSGTSTQTSPRNIFDSASGSSIGYGATIYGVPCDASNVIITNITPPFPAGFSITPNGITTVVAGTLPFDQRFTFDICPVATPGINCVSVIYDATIRGGVWPGYDRAVYNPNTLSFCSGAGFASNILDNDVIENCATIGMGVPATMSNCTYSQIGSNPFYTINTTTGVIETRLITIPAGLGIQTLTYQLCYNGIAGNCRTATLRIKTSTAACDPNFRMANNNGVKTEILAENGIIIYPNPSKDIFNIVFDDFLNDELSIVVYNLLGQKVWSENTTDKDLILDISNQPIGTYLVRISDGEETIIKKIMKQ